MYNTFTFDNNYFNWVSLLNIEIISWEIVYNGYVLHQTNNCYLSLFQWYNAPIIELNNFELPNTDWLWNNSAFYRQNEFIIRWILKGENAEKLREQKDRFKKFLTEQNKILQVNFNWEIRRAHAFVLWLENLFNNQHYNINHINFELTFQIQKWYWEDIKTNSITYENITSNLQEEINNLWTYKSFPKFILNFITASWTDEIKLIMWDNQILINETIWDGDLLVIDSKEKELLFNWVPIDFDWVFPILELWLNPFAIEINWTFSCDITVQFVKTFI